MRGARPGRGTINTLPCSPTLPPRLGRPVPGQVPQQYCLNGTLKTLHLERVQQEKIVVIKPRQDGRGTNFVECVREIGDGRGCDGSTCVGRSVRPCLVALAGGCCWQRLYWRLLSDLWCLPRGEDMSGGGTSVQVDRCSLVTSSWRLCVCHKCDA